MVWATRAGGTDISDQDRAIATDNFHGAATFGAGEANQAVLTGADSDNIFIAKYDPDGGLVWAQSPSSIEPDAPSRGTRIAVDGAGTSYVTGRFQGAVMFGAGEANETELISAGGSDIFVAVFGGTAVLDSDQDGVPDDIDYCPETALPEIAVPGDRLLPNRFAITDQGPSFSSGRPGATRETFTIVDTSGCSCEQIIDLMGLDDGHRRFGCSLGGIRAFIASLP